MLAFIGGAGEASTTRLIRDLELCEIHNNSLMSELNGVKLKWEAALIEIEKLRQDLGEHKGAYVECKQENIELRRELREALKTERDLLGRMSNRLGLLTDEQTQTLAGNSRPQPVGGRTMPWSQAARIVEKASAEALKATPEADERANHWSERIAEIEAKDALGKSQESVKPSNGQTAS